MMRPIGPHERVHFKKGGGEAIESIDDLCAYVEMKLRKHRGIKTKNLDDYLAWFLFMKMMIGTYGYKAYRVVAHMLIERKKLLKFRDLFPRKSKKQA